MSYRFILACLLCLFSPLVQAQPESSTRTVGLLQNHAEAFDGYTLLAPLQNAVTYLLDGNGDIVHQWNHQYRPGAVTYFLPNGHLLRTANTQNERFLAGGRGGRIEEFDWDGNLVWWFEYTDTNVSLHHDVEYLPNGNILMIAWEYKTGTEAIEAGRDSTLLPQSELWPDKIIEVQPTYPHGGEIVWSWHAWDHLVQEFDSTKANYGRVADHPELIDLNYDPSNGQADWLHFNSIDYNPELEQIIISVPRFDEVWVIDHSTTTEEAAGHTGGRSGRGGDLLYRWGNPITYKRGSASPRQLFFQHDAQWIEEGLPGAGNILIFNNGSGARPYSSIDELIPPLQADGTYALDATAAFSPEVPHWQFVAADHFYSSFISGMQRLPNGNTLITEGDDGRIFEVTSSGQLVWEYVNPVTDERVLAQDETVPDGRVGKANLLFRAYRYAPDYPGLAGKSLIARGPVENPPLETSIAAETLPEGYQLAQNYPNPFNPQTTIAFTLAEASILSLNVYNLLGEHVATVAEQQAFGYGTHALTFDGSGLPSGTYMYRLETPTFTKTRRMILLK